MTQHRDPGWGAAVRAAGPFLFLPFFPLVAYALRGKALDALTTLRVLFLQYASALVLILVVSFFLQPRLVSGDVPLPLMLMLGAGWTASIVGVQWARSKPLDTSDENRLLGSYRTMFFVSMAFAQSAALFGFVGVFLLDALWPYLVGLAVAAYGFSTFAPTAGNLERRQREIVARGSDLSLPDALSRRPEP